MVPAHHFHEKWTLGMADHSQGLQLSRVGYG